MCHFGVYMRRRENLFVPNLFRRCLSKTALRLLGHFLHLEDQLCSYDGSGDSPDRLDSMVYALIDLMVAARVPQFLFAAVDPAKISLILRAKYEFPLLIHPHYFAD